jgi:hypothetical protein
VLPPRSAHVPASALRAALGLVLFPLALAGQEPDPFLAGERWSSSSAASIPRSIAFAGGELVWCASSGSSGEVALFPSAPLAAADAAAEPFFREASALAGALGRIQVQAGDEAGELFALVQTAAPDAARRRTLVLGFDALDAARGASFAPRWSHDPELRGNAPALFATSAGGDVLVVALAAAASGTLRVDRLDAHAGSLLERVDLAAGAPKGLALAPSGERAVLTAGLELFVLERGELLLQRTLQGSTAALALSGDGRVLAHGDLERVLVHEEVAGTYAPLATIDGQSSELPVALALSHDGRTLAITWWDFLDGTSVRLDVLDVRTRVRTNSYAQRGAADGLQNFPSALRMTPDGERIALGLWGAGDERPELVLLRRDDPELVLAVDLPGSVEALDLDPTGTRVALATKDAHANRFAASGRVARYDSGERELALVQGARPGGTLEVALRSTQALRSACFVVGLRREVPRTLRRLGPLFLDLGGPLHFAAGTLDAAGCARARLAVPATSSVIGLPLGIQGLGLSSGGPRLAPILVEPPIL